MARGHVSLGDLLGWDGGRLAGLVTESLIVPAPVGEYPVVESAHGLLCDVFANALIVDSAAPMS